MKHGTRGPEKMCFNLAQRDGNHEYGCGVNDLKVAHLGKNRLPPLGVAQGLRTCHKTQVNTPYDTNRASKDYTLVHWNPKKAYQAYRRPKLVTVLHHWPQFGSTICLHNIHGIDACISLRVDIAHVSKKHERIDYRADCLVQQELDKNIGLA